MSGQMAVQNYEDSASEFPIQNSVVSTPLTLLEPTVCGGA